MILKTKYKLCIFTKDNYEYKTFRASLFRLLSDGDLQVKIFVRNLMLSDFMWQLRNNKNILHETFCSRFALRS